VVIEEEGIVGRSLVVEGVVLGRQGRRSVTKDSHWIWPRRRRDKLDLGDKERSRTRDLAEKERRAMSEAATGSRQGEESRSVL
jgi:hypothetical protein